MSEILSKYSAFLDFILDLHQRYLPLWISTVVITVIMMTIGLFLGAFVHPIFMLLFTAFPFYFAYAALIKNQDYSRALRLIFLWTFTIAIYGILLTIVFPDLATKAIFNSTAYKEEMFTWIETGIGAEGNPAQFIPIHATHFTIFLITCLISMSMIGIIFGAYLMNYMDYYVGMLFLNVAEPSATSYLTIAVFGWQIWAICRVVDFLFVGTAAAIPLTTFLFKQPLPKDVIKKYFLIGVAFVIIDILLKASLAPIYQQILNAVIFG